MSRPPAKAKQTASSSNAWRIAASADVRFEVTPSRFGIHVVLYEARSAALTIQQSMNFASSSQFVEWHDNEDKRHRFPSAYERLKAHVLSLFRERALP